MVVEHSKRRAPAAPQASGSVRGTPLHGDVAEKALELPSAKSLDAVGAGLLRRAAHEEPEPSRGAIVAPPLVQPVVQDVPEARRALGERTLAEPEGERA